MQDLAMLYINRPEKKKNVNIAKSKCRTYDSGSQLVGNNII